MAVSGSDLTKPYAAYPSAEGFRSAIDETGDVRSEFEGKTCAIDVDTDNHPFFRDSVPGILQVDSDKERALALAASGCATARTEVAMMTLAADHNV